MRAAFRCRVGEDRQERLYQEIWPFQYDRQRAIETGFIELLKRSQVGEACINKENIKIPKVCWSSSATCF